LIPEFDPAPPPGARCIFTAGFFIAGERMQESQAAGEAISARDLWTNEAQPRGLAPIFKIIKHRMDVDEALPWRLAVEGVLNQLDESGYTGYHLVRTGQRAETVTEETEFSLELDCEAEKSFWEVDPNEPQKYIRRGSAGVIEWLRAHWLHDDANEEGLATFDRGRLCMLHADAESMFGYGKVPASTVVQLILPAQVHSDEDEAALLARIKAHQPMKRARGRWQNKPAMLAELLRQYNERMRSLNATSGLCEEQLGQLWGFEPTSVHSYLTEARKSIKDKKAA
jgi:hypothetical protein